MFIPLVFQQSLARGQAIPRAVEQPFPWVRLLLVFLLSLLFTIDKSAQYSLWSGISMLRSKGSPVTSPSSKAPGASHQDQRSFLKKADETTPATRAYLLPARFTPTSPPCLFLTDLRQANTFHWNKTNAIKKPCLTKRAKETTGETLCRTSPEQQISLGVREPSRLPHCHRQRWPAPLGSPAGSWECSVYVTSCQSERVRDRKYPALQTCRA